MGIIPRVPKVSSGHLLLKQTGECLSPLSEDPVGARIDQCLLNLVDIFNIN